MQEYEGENRLQQTSRKKVSIIFCTKNSASTIENAINAIKDSRYDLDIIVVDGFSNDKTAEKAKRAGASDIIQQSEKKFPGKALR